MTVLREIAQSRFETGMWSREPAGRRHVVEADR